MATLVEAKSSSHYFQSHLDTSRTPTRLHRGKHIGVNMRTTIEKVFGALGGWEGMCAWAKDNPDVFYGQVVPKLLPKDLSGGLGNITVIVQRTPNDQTPLTIEHATCPQADTTTGSGSGDLENA